MITFRGKEYTKEPPKWWRSRAVRDKDAGDIVKKWNDFWLDNYGVPRWIFYTPEQCRPWWY